MDLISCGTIYGSFTDLDGVVFVRDEYNVYRSTNQGDKWIDETSFSGNCFAVNTNEEVFLGSDNLIRKSTDEGITWLTAGTFSNTAIILATGFKDFDPSRVPELAYGRLENVITAPEFERLVNVSGPTAGRVMLKNGLPPKSVAIVHCVGSRDKHHNNYCSNICCMQSLKFAHLVKEKTGATVHNFYLDIRTAFKDYDEFYQRVLDEGTLFVRGPSRK